MSSINNILYLFVLFLIMGSGATIASDDNPWRLEEPDDRQDLYFDLNGRGLAGAVRPDQKETIRAKSPSLKGRNATSGAIGKLNALGKQNRDQVFGYSGAQSRSAKTDSASTDASRFGAFPSQDGGVKEAQKSGPSVPAKKGIQFGGKSFGAFPPKEKKAGRDLRQKLQKNLRERQRLLQQGASGFANVLPRPIPAPVPHRAYPNTGPRYGAPQGYGPGYGSGSAPIVGAGVPGNIYGPSFVDPGTLGYALPGFMQ